MNITILQGPFYPVPPVRGGAVQKMWHLLGIEFARRGHQVTSISRAVPELPATEILDGVQHVRVGGYNQPAGGLAIKALDFCYTLRALRAAPPADILVTNSFFAPLFARAKLGRVYVDVQRMPKGQMRLYRRAARLRANSSPVEQAILDDDPQARGRTAMIPNPLPFTPARPPAWEKKTKTILYVGRIHPEKGVDLLLKAFAKARILGLSDWELRLVGPWDTPAGGGGAAWQQHLRDTLPQEGVCWTGPIYDMDALNNEYDRATVFAYPSLAERGETFGLAPLEAMAWGCVPVVSDLACFRDYLAPSVNGLSFDHRSPAAADALANALVQAASSAGPALARAAALVRESHAIHTIADRFLADFKSLLNSSDR